MQGADGHLRLNPADFPSPPAAIARVVRLASDPDVTSDTLGAVIASDPAFTAELLRTVNSPFHGLKQPVTAAARAVTILGIRALRNLAICFAVRDSLRNSGLRDTDLQGFWEDCLRRAVAARAIARLTGTVSPEEAFTIGLLQDFGVLALLRANRGQAAHWAQWRLQLPEARREIEMTQFGISHDGIAKLLGERWSLPPQFVDALANHHFPEKCGLPSRDLAFVAFHADNVGALLTGRSSAALAAVRGGLRETYQIEEAITDKFLDALPGEVEDAAAGLGMRVARQAPFANILAEANRTLVQMNMSYQEITGRLEAALVEKERLMEQLAAANAELARLASFDSLTGLSSRRHYETLFRELLTRAAATGKPVSLVMVDLDNFKRVNDNYGHPTGDAVLRSTAAAILANSHDADIKARLGGEELAVVLPDTDAHQALASSERLREAIARASVTTGKGPLRVTASFGVATFMGSGQAVDVERLATMLTDLADKALYQSKEHGRNRVTVGGLIR
ncbi:MAG: GGDEF domain-containing protein [Myxococcales bacterium]|nr:GGDEF domain-containing protein [Myxococcales bacterium]